MSSYQNLKTENEILWQRLTLLIKTEMCQRCINYEDAEKATKDALKAIKWEIKRAQYEKKDRD